MPVNMAHKAFQWENIDGKRQKRIKLIISFRTKNEVLMNTQETYSL